MLGMSKKRRHTGFTLVELMVITPIVMLAVIGTMALLVNLVAENAITNAENSISAEAQNALSEVQNSLSSAEMFLVTNGLSDSGKSGNYGSASDTPNSSQPFRGMQIIGKTYDQVVETSGKVVPAYKNSPADCSTAARVSNGVQNTNTIYFAKQVGSTARAELKRRVLTTEPRNICGTSIFLRSCEAGYSSPCDNDDTLARDVVSFNITYYNASGTSISGAAANTAVAAKVELMLKKSVGGKDISYKGSVRFNLLNTLPPPSSPPCPGTFTDQSITGSTSGGTVWGTDIYTDDSNRPMAAVHAGVISAGQTATVRVCNLPGQSSYTGSTRNGVTTNSYSSWGGSISFTLP